MLTARSYRVTWDAHACLWQVGSRSGLVLFESACRREVSAVCARLNRRFPRRRSPVNRAIRPQPSFCDPSNNFDAAQWAFAPAASSTPAFADAALLAR